MLALIVYVVILGIVWWAITSLVPIAEPFLTVAKVLIVIFLIYVLLSAFGMWSFPMPHRVFGS